MIDQLIVTVYGLGLLFILCNSLVQAHLLYHYLKHRLRRAKLVPSTATEENTWLSREHRFPFVTVQLPVYNEVYVVERLLRAVAAFDYPADRFEIQVLDDSTDETTDLVAQQVVDMQHRGITVHHVRRSNRVGFKAGALAAGLRTAQGTLLAIFDADFLPPTDFLQKTVPCFRDPSVGMVQTRWEHLNEQYSLLTRVQAFGLNVHFSVEQQGRHASGRFINFNGTAGIWCKACIIDAGSWTSDTLTEDLDLSYRAQMRGWKFRYLEEVGSPAELPVVMNALKTQQFRWTKGAAECARKNLPALLTGAFPTSTKLHGLFHLMNSFLFVCSILVAILSVPILFIKNQSHAFDTFFTIGSVSMLSMLLLILVYWVAFTKSIKKHPVTFGSFLKNLLLFLLFSMGLSLHNAIAVLEGYAGRQTPFIRTPKFNIGSAKEGWKKNKYLTGRINPLTLVEGLLCLYFMAGIGLAFVVSDFGFVPVHLLMALGFGLVFYYSLAHTRGVQQN